MSLPIIKSGKDTWKFKPRHCANGSKHIRGSVFTETFIPVMGACTVPYSTALTDSWNIIGGLIDVTNAFKNTILSPAEIFYILIPPYFLK